MRTLEGAIEIRASPEAVFDLIHDYGRRLEWDPFLKEACSLEGAEAAGLGVKTPMHSPEWICRPGDGDGLPFLRSAEGRRGENDEGTCSTGDLRCHAPSGGHRVRTDPSNVPVQFLHQAPLAPGDCRPHRIGSLPAGSAAEAQGAQVLPGALTMTLVSRGAERRRPTTGCRRRWGGWEMLGSYQAGLVLDLTAEEDIEWPLPPAPRVPAAVTAGSVGTIMLGLRDNAGRSLFASEAEVHSLAWSRFIGDQPVG